MFQKLKGFTRAFWTANIVELLERGAYYGVFKQTEKESGVEYFSNDRILKTVLSDHLILDFSLVVIFLVYLFLVLRCLF